MSRNGKVTNWAEVYQKFEKRCAIKRVKASSMANYEAVMGRFCDWADSEGIAPADFGPLDAEEYLGTLTREDGLPYKTNSLRTHCRNVKTLLNFAADRKIIPDKIKVEMPKSEDDKIKALTGPELEKTLAHFEADADAAPDVKPNTKPGENIRNAAIIHVLKDSGLRAAELLALNWEDLSWDEERQLGTIQVTKQMNRKREFVPTKNGKNRKTFFYADAWHWLSKYKAEQLIRWAEVAAEMTDGWSEEGWDQLPFDPAKPVFWLSYGEPERMGASGLGYMLRTAGKKLGVPLHPHLFRHTAGRLMTKAGLSPVAIMQVLGHSDLTMVMRYSKLWGPDLAEVMAEAMNGKR